MLSRYSLLGTTAAIALYATLGCGLEQTDFRVQVTDATTGNPLVGASVEVDYLQAPTNAGGQARFNVRPGAHDLTVSCRGYEQVQTAVVLYNAGMAVKSIAMMPLSEPVNPPSPPAPSPGASPQPGASPSPTPAKGLQIFGKLTDGTGVRIPKASVYVESEWGIPFGTADSNAVGEYRIGKLPKGQALRVTAIADGYKSRSRVVTPTADWRLDFTGIYALTPNTAQTPSVGAGTTLVTGRVEDVQGRGLSGVIIKADSSDVRYPFKETTIARNGAFEIAVPTDLPLRFIASKYGYRSVTFTETIASAHAGERIRLDFKGQRALDRAPMGASSVVNDHQEAPEAAE
jgi:hypothetical protein